MIRLFLFLFYLSILPISPSQADSPDNSTHPEIRSLLRKMTLEEKIGQLMQYSWDQELTGPKGQKIDLLKEIEKGRVGSLLNLTGAKETKRIQEIAVKKTRLGIPLILGYDVIHGYKTIFPIPLGEAASWDLDAIEKSARVAATEAAAAGIHWTFAPMVDISRDPRWGRIMESAGEDPYLGACIAAARVKGFQGENLMDVNTILACAKHFAAYGAAIAGRDYNTVDISELTLREIYLPPFKAAHDAGVGSFMSAFNDFNGIPATGNHFLINGILKKEWNFKGFVVSDWGSIREMMVHGVAKTETDAAKMAITAGVDMDMMNFVYFNELPALVRDNQIKETKIDEAVGRILLMKKNLGLFEDPYRYCDEQRETGLLLHPQHLETAREVAKKSIVLLKNENNLLPLSKKITSIAVIGPLADNKDDLIATWSAKGEGGEAVSLLEGIKNKVSSQTKLYYAEGCKIDDHNTSKIEEAVNVAQNADVIIAVMGESKMMSGEALSRAYLDLPGVQNELLQQLHLTGKSIIVVLMNGRPLVLNWMSKNIPAILETWLLGTQAGNAIVDVLFGDYNPSGKLPVSFPYAVGQIPVYYNQKITGRPKVPNNRYCSRYIDIPNEPLYPFGFGLSYTTFEYSEIQLNKNKIQPNDTLTVTIKITNAGKLKGEEVVQLYLQDLIGSTTRPVKSLKKFKKIALYAGETREVGFKLSASDFGLYNQNMEFVVEPGDFNVFIGTNSIDTKRAGFVITE